MKWKCTVCGYIHEGDTPPEECPLCHVGKDKFVPADEQPAVDGKPTDKPRKWICTVCKYVHEGNDPPDECPVCHVGKEKFEPLEEAPAEKPAEKTVETAAPARKWRCTVCGYIHERDAPPDICPVCKKPWSAFVPHVEEATPAASAEPAPARDAKNGKPIKADRWRCVVCNYVHEGADPPDVCPVCGAGKDQFVPETRSPEHHHRGVSGLIEKLHLHPVAAHFPNGALPLSVAAWFAFLVFDQVCLERASFYLMLVATLAVPVTFIAGLSDAKHRFGTTTTGVFPEKKLWSWVLLVVCGAAAFWRLSLGWTHVPSTMTEIAVYSGLLLVATASAARLGMLGGKLVFGH